MKTQIDLKRALCGAAVGAGIFSEGAGRDQLFTAENVAWVSDTQTGKVLTKGRSIVCGLDHREGFAGPKPGGQNSMVLNAATTTSDSPTATKMTHSAEFPRWKVTLDMVVILLILPFVLPLAVLVAALIRMVSTGPVLFRQERVGYLGRKFMCFKFRTMFVGAETTTHQGHLQHLMKSDAPMVKLDARGDSRIIPFGLWLRSSGLDELPQLINVFRGEMSIVGPRPCTAYEYDDYLPWQRERFNTLPGLTGLWQVSGKNRTTFAEMMQLDISYARKKTLWLDLTIIFKTVPAILGQVSQARKKKKALPLEAQTPQSYQPIPDNLH